MNRRIEEDISKLLSWGTTVSILLMCFGTLTCFYSSGEYGTAGGSASDLKHLLASSAPFQFSFPGMLEGILHGQGQAITVCGLLLLIATPMARVLFSLVSFVVKRDWCYALMTAVVFALLTLAFWVGRETPRLTSLAEMQLAGHGSSQKIRKP